MSGFRQRSRAGSIASLALAVCLCLGAGFIGALATTSSVTTWYQELVRPAWTPPDSVFGPVWTTLYVLMGIAAWLVWERRHEAQTRGPLLLFVLQLALNAVWSLVFFGLRRPGLALVEIALLWVAIAATLWSFARVRRSAAALLAPYLAWVTFAVALNAAIWSMNR